MHETPREAVADEDQAGLAGVGRFNCTVRRKNSGHMHAVTRTQVSSRRSICSTCPSVSGVPVASYYCCRELRARYLPRHLIGSIAVP